MKGIFAIVFGLLFSSQAALFYDQFTNGTTSVNTDPTVSIGPNYASSVLTQAGSPAGTPSFNVNADGRVLITLAGNARQIFLYQNAYETKSGGGNSFSVSGDVTTIPTVANSALYGMAFNIQDDGSCYSVRINTGTAGTVACATFVYWDAIGGSITTNLAMGNFATSSVVSMAISSDTAGVFDITLTGTMNGVFSNYTYQIDVATDLSTAPLLNGGHAGFYINNGNSNVSFDNLRIETIPEPATMGLLGISFGTIMLWRRLRR